MAFSLDLKRVLISDSVDSCCKTILETNGIVVDLKTKLTKEELLAEIPVSVKSQGSLIFVASHSSFPYTLLLLLL